MRKLLALDIGEVCIQLNPVAHTEELAGDLSVLLAALEDMECGRIGEDEFFARASKKLNREHHELRDWFGGIIGAEMPGMAKVIERILPEWDFVFISDISSPHLALCRTKISFFHHAVGAVYSFDAGCRKPSAGMYEYFEKNYGVPDLYVDDRPQNIAAAVERGWRSRQFLSVSDLENHFNML